MSTQEDKRKSLSDVLAKLNKEYGKNTVGLYGDMPTADVETVPTGSLGLDLALGVGGYPRGRIVEIYGAEASGKTSMTLHAIAEVQKVGGVAAFIDAEHALDPSYAEALGVDMEAVAFSQPDSAEQALEIVEELVRSNAVDIIVVDSVAALVPEAEIAGDMGDSHMGLQARLMSQALRKLAPVVSKSKTILFFINQTRSKIGVMYGSNETTTGGNALKFYSSVRLQVKRIGAIKNGDTVTGGKTKIKVVKNKVAPPFRECEFDIVFGKGINKVGEILDAAVVLGIVNKSGAWYEFDGGKAQGREGTVAWLTENPDKLESLTAQVRSGLGMA